MENLVLAVITANEQRVGGGSLSVHTREDRRVPWVSCPPPRTAVPPWGRGGTFPGATKPFAPGRWWALVLSPLHFSPYLGGYGQPAAGGCPEGGSVKYLMANYSEVRLLLLTWGGTRASAQPQALEVLLLPPVPADAGTRSCSGGGEGEVSLCCFLGFFFLD